MDKEAVMRNDWLRLIFYFQDSKGNLWNILWQVCEPNEVIHRDTEGTEGPLPAEQDSVGRVSYPLLQHGWGILRGKIKQRQNSDSVASALLTRRKLSLSNHCAPIVLKKVGRENQLFVGETQIFFEKGVHMGCCAQHHCDVLSRETSMLLEISHEKPVSCYATGLRCWNNMSWITQKVKVTHGIWIPTFWCLVLCTHHQLLFFSWLVSLQTVSAAFNPSQMPVMLFAASSVSPTGNMSPYRTWPRTGHVSKKLVELLAPCKGRSRPMVSCSAGWPVWFFSLQN